MENKEKNTFKEDVKEFLIENIVPLLLTGLGVLIMLVFGKV